MWQHPSSLAWLGFGGGATTDRAQKDEEEDLQALPQIQQMLDLISHNGEGDLGISWIIP